MKFSLFVNDPETLPEELKSLVKSIPEERANRFSHGLALLFFLFLGPFLIYKAFQVEKEGYLLGSVLFLISIFMVYASSTLYHSVYDLKRKKKLRTVDHICIYFLISASFSPFILFALRTPLGFKVFAILWLMVLVGTVFKYFFTHKYNFISTLAYVAMGSMAFFILEPLKNTIPELSYTWIQIGGISYVIGVIFYLWKRLYFNHLIWHIFVFGGSISHFLAIWYLV